MMMDKNRIKKFLENNTNLLVFITLVIIFLIFISVI
jgi:hypothetical protein